MRPNNILTALALAAAIAVPAGVSAQSRPIVYSPSSMLNGLSDNGAYAIGSTMGDEDVDNPHRAGGVWIELDTRREVEIAAPSGWSEANDVADNGMVVGSSMGRPGIWDPQSRQWSTYNVPSEWAGGSFNAVTPDGRYAVGYFFDANSDFDVAPMMYDLATGENITPANLPTRDLTGLDRRQNVLYGISADGRYLLGEISQSYLGDLDEATGEMVPALFSYVYDRETSSWSPIGYTHNAATGQFAKVNDNLHYINNQFMSCDGSWVTGSAYMVYNGGESKGGSENFYSYRYEVATGAFEVYDHDTEAGVVGNKITNDGVVLSCSPYGNPYPTAMVRYGKYFMSLDQIIEQTYGIRVPDLIHDSVTGSFQAISADGLTALMVTYDNSYIITMPEPFVEAAANVDLLSNYTVNIPNGSTIHRVSEIQITFDRVVECLANPQSVRLLDGSGNLVRNASGISISNTDSHTVVVRFRSTILNAGETYTIDIPAGMVWIQEDPSVKAKAIQIHYTGRADGPIALRAVSPAEGAAISQLNSNPDYITLTFDTPVAVSANGSCALYNADTEELITYLNASVSDSQVTFFPTSEYQLYRGTNYKVVVAQGTVTDLSGDGGNETIELHYVGAYVRELSADDIYIYSNKCDDYSNFIFWSGETNEPAAIPRGWGFTAESTWVLVRDNEESTDQALAAHSMFTTPAESDSWLVTPQLYIPDANTHLAFDAQSYLRSREDRLEVYIYSDDAVYNYFSEELRDTFLGQGDKVLDEIVDAGASDEHLNGEWTHYTVPLEAYAGKNIYIAFAYRNNNKSAIFIDNVQVVRNLNFLLTNQTPTAVVDRASVEVKGTVSSASEIMDFSGINIRLYDAEGNQLDEIDDTQAQLSYGDTYSFAFATELPLAVGKETAYSIRVSSGPETTTYTYTVKDLVFEPVKRVVLEEYTGSACGNCPLGIQAIELLQRLYPDNFIAVTLRTYQNDMYGNGAVEYTNYLGLNAAPTGRINRGEVLSPMLQNGSQGYQFFGRGIITSDGEEAYLWADAVQDELKTPAEAEVTVSPSYDAESGRLEVASTVRFAIDRDNSNMAVFAVVVENNLPCFQLNYFNNTSDPNLGPWGAGGIYSQGTVTTWLANDVVRLVVNGNAYGGTSLRESQFTAGESYTVNLQTDVPAGRLSNPENCRVVAMLIDRSTGRVINASEERFSMSGITDVTTDDDAPAEYYDLQGRKVQQPAPGHIYIRVQGGQAAKIRM